MRRDRPVVWAAAGEFHFFPESLELSSPDRPQITARWMFCGFAVEVDRKIRPSPEDSAGFERKTGRHLSRSRWVRDEWNDVYGAHTWMDTFMPTQVDDAKRRL